MNIFKGIRGCNEPKCGLRKSSFSTNENRICQKLDEHLGQFLQSFKEREVLTTIGLFDRCLQVLKWISFKYVCIKPDKALNKSKAFNGSNNYKNSSLVCIKNTPTDVLSRVNGHKILVTLLPIVYIYQVNSNHSFNTL